MPTDKREEARRNLLNWLSTAVWDVREHGAILDVTIRQFEPLIDDLETEVYEDGRKDEICTEG